jgi:hypothetical protein
MPFEINSNRLMFLALFLIVAVSAWSLFGGDLNVFLDYVMKTVDKEEEGFQSGGTCGCNKEQKKWF